MSYRFSISSLVVIGLVALCAYQTYAATRRANQGTFFHLSDWHIDPFYDANETSSDFCRKPIVLDDIENVLFPEQFYSHSIYNKKWYSALQNSTGPNYEFGQYGCDSPRLLAEIA